MMGILPGGFGLCFRSHQVTMTKLLEWHSRRENPVALVGWMNVGRSKLVNNNGPGSPANAEGTQMISQQKRNREQQ
jgi:hypothetical protein